jgi:beta-ureidopropionase / N-carbamoyl-L-amino-acid hydrolase
MTSFNSLWEAILDVGREPATGGYRRFAWTAADLTLREWFTAESQRRGMTVEEDRNGNTWAWWMPSGWSGDPKGAFVTGSHLDSVPDGGAFDGPLGVVSAFHAVDVLRARGVAPRVPIAVVAFADEEGARFGVACVGSQLSTGALTAERALRLRDNEGISLADALRGAGRNPEHLGTDETLTERVGIYVELHVEQGRGLEDLGQPLAVASSIWPHGRWHLTFGGEANHAGTTRLVDRRDPMLPFASAVHAARIEAGRYAGVATFGKVRVTPNGANAIPSRVDAWLDARAADEATLATVVDAIRDAAAHYAREGHVTLEFEAESITPIVAFPDTARRRVQAALSRFGDIPVLPTAAGHDAGILSAKVPTAMLFVRNPTGVSHSPEEYAEIADCRTGAEALADVMADWVSR